MVDDSLPDKQIMAAILSLLRLSGDPSFLTSLHAFLVASETEHRPHQTPSELQTIVCKIGDCLKDISKPADSSKWADGPIAETHDVVDEEAGHLEANDPSEAAPAPAAAAKAVEEFSRREVGQEELVPGATTSTGWCLVQ